MLNEPWRFTLLGQFRAEQGPHQVTRFRTRAAGELLAYLALHPERAHPRDDLQELLWPLEDLDVGRNRLRVALSSLRRQFEPPGVPRGAVIVASRPSVNINAAAFTTDVSDFERSLADARAAQADRERAAHLQTAVGLYRGQLLPTYGSEWVETERDRLDRAYIGALRTLTRHLLLAREFDTAVECALQAVNADPLREELHRDLLRVYMAAGHCQAALKHFAALKTLLMDRLGVLPSAATRSVLEPAGRGTPAGIAGSDIPYPVLLEPNSGSFRTAAGPEDAISRSAAPEGHLPPEVTRIFGRETELARLEEMLAPVDSRLTPVASVQEVGRPRSDSRFLRSSGPLVTLTGPGGIGKTRLAIAVARRLCHRFTGGAWFVSLGEVTDSAMIARALRGGLKLSPHSELDPLEQVIQFLLTRGAALLVLDNFEQLLEDGAEIVRTLIDCLPEVTLLVTSRRSLGLQGEREFPVAPLEVPLGGEGAGELAQVPSVRLLIDRAQAIRPDFQVTERNARAVAELCRRLEGIPLAVELAAARVRVLTPAQMLDNLERRVELLVDPRSDRAARHRSLRAAIAWSYRLLPPPLQRCFARLSVFRGGWDAEAAVSVCQEPDSLACLEQLQSHSLISATEYGESMRFHMLESLREFARDQLAPSEQASLRCLHAEYFTRLTEETASGRKLEREATALDMLEWEHENLRAALTWAAETGRFEIGVRLATAAHKFWEIRGHHAEGLDWLTRMLDGAQGLTPALRGAAYAAAGNLATWQHRYTEAASLFRHGLPLFRETGDTRGLASALNGLGIAAYYAGKCGAAGSYWQKSLALWRELGEGCKIANALHNLADLEESLGHFDAARALGEESLCIWREEGDLLGTSFALGLLGSVEADLGRYDQAETLFIESLIVLRHFGHRGRTVSTMLNLANLRQLQERYEDAREWLEQCACVSKDLGSPATHVDMLCGFGRLAIASKRMDRGATLFGAAEGLSKALGRPFIPVPRSHSYRSIRAAVEAIKEASHATAWEAGYAMTIEQSVRYALAG